MTKGPVRGMKVDEREAEFKLVHRGKTYYFCTAVCMRGFRKHPLKYIKES